MSVSGLTAVPDSQMLHQAHQLRDVDSPGDRFVQILDFQTPKFGQSNRVFIPPLEMVPDDLWVVFNMRSNVPLGAANVNSPQRMVPTQSWLGTSGAQLLYKATSVYTMSEPEAVVYNEFMSENADQRMNREHMTGVAAGQADYQLYTNNVIVAPNNFTYETLFYMNLRPLCEKVFCNIGSLNAYAASSWSIDVHLRKFAELILTGATNNFITNAEAVITSMKLYITGHREDAQNAMRVSQALAKDGVKVIFEQANHARTEYTGAGTNVAKAPVTVVMADLEGEVTDILVYPRVKLGLIAPTTTRIGQPGSPETQTDSVYSYPGSTIELGTQSNPVRVFGQAVPMEFVRRVSQGAGYEGASFRTITNRTSGIVGGARGSAMMISLSEKPAAGQKFGMFSGSLRLKNDFRMTLRWDLLEARDADVLDTIVYIRRVLVITHAGIIMVNEE